IIEIQSIILIPNESPMQTLFPGIRFKCIEFILYLNVDVFILSMTLTALSLNNPNGAVLHHNDVIGIEQPLVLKSVYIDNREVLLPGITVFVYPLNILPTLAI